MKSGRFQPPLWPSCLGTVLLSALSLFTVAQPEALRLPKTLEYAVYTGAGLCFFLAVWALVVSFRRGSPLRAAAEAVRRNRLLGRLLDDDDFRIVSAGYGSLALNGLLALVKLTAGWWYSSMWFTALAGYHVVLCAAKALVLHGSRAACVNPWRQLRREWASYSRCGLLLLVLSLTLQGIAILIVREGRGFRYGGYWIFAVALYDFYCLATSLAFLFRRRHRHTPIIRALKSMNLATSLVSMLSLQTAMFASFGGDPAMQRLMNLATGSSVCVLLVALGVGMAIHGTKQRQMAERTDAERPTAEQTPVG